MSPRPPDGARGGGGPEPTTFEEAYRLCKPLVLWALGQRGIHWPAADDACQNVFARFHRRVLADGAMPRPVRTTLLGIVEDEAMNTRRSWRRHPEGAEPGPEGPDSRPDQEQALGRLQAAKQAMAAIGARMKKEDMELVMLADLGMSYEELAALRGTTRENIGVQLFRARARFREVGAPIYDLLYGSRRGS